MGIGREAANRNAVGDELLAVLPIDGKPWYKRAHLVKLHFCVFSLMMFSSANGYDGSLMNGLQALPQWQLFMDTPSGAWLGFINAIYWLGSGIIYLITPWLSNKYGRKVGVYIGYIFLVVGVALCAGRHQAAFVLSRFFIGCASACFGSTVPLLMNEIAYPTHRGVVNALFWCGWHVGGTLAAFITFGTRDLASDWAWRLPAVLQVMLPALALPALIITPESPRWLVDVGRNDEAKAILSYWHAGGDTASELVNYEIIEISETLHKEKHAHAAGSYVEMCRTHGNRYRLFISVTLGFFCQWSGNGVVSYYLALVLKTVGIGSTHDQTLISACLQIWNLIFSLGAAFSVDRIGRRPLFLASAAIMFVAFSIVTGLSGAFAETKHGPTGIAVVPFIFLFNSGYDIALTPFQTAYPCEIWPYHLRSRGLNIALISAVVAVFFNTFVNPIALEAIGWKYYFVFLAVLIAMGFTAYFFYPETRGHTLEQMAVIFDGPSAETSDPVETVARSRSAASTKNFSVVSRVELG